MSSESDFLYVIGDWNISPLRESSD